MVEEICISIFMLILIVLFFGAIPIAIYISHQYLAAIGTSFLLLALLIGYGLKKDIDSGQGGGGTLAARCAAVYAIIDFV